jgi:AraC-like DNA-binding protein
MEKENSNNALRQLIESTYLQNLTLLELAEKHGVSLATFKRHFTKEYGTSPHSYIKTRRLEKAKELILNTDRSISDIYKEIGFEEIAHFSKSFKAHFGVNPSRIKSLFN